MLQERYALLFWLQVRKTCLPGFAPVKSVRVLQAKRLTHKGFPATIYCFTFKSVELSAQREALRNGPEGGRRAQD